MFSNSSGVKSGAIAFFNYMVIVLDYSSININNNEMNNLNVLVEIAVLDGLDNPVRYWETTDTANVAFVKDMGDDVISFITYSLNLVTNDYDVDEQKYKRRKSS